MGRRNPTSPLKRPATWFLAEFMLAVSIMIFTNQDAVSDDDLMPVPAILHVHSSASDAMLNIDGVVKSARNAGVKVILFTDDCLVRIEYGLWPLRKIIRYVFDRNSVFKYGIKRYLREIESAQEKNPDLILISGVETSPFYYWKGNPFKGDLKLRDWDKRLFIVGLDDVKDYANLPLISNERRPYRRLNIPSIWPVLGLVIGASFLKKREFNYTDAAGNRLGKYSRPWRVLGAFTIILSLLFAFNNFPFTEFKYDQYHGDQGIGPYQDLIDYTRERGGLTFWAYPNSARTITYTMQFGKDVVMETGSHNQDILKAKDYTGFAIFHGGYYQTGEPGGIWDTALNEYCKGERTMPVWAVSELNFDSTKDLSNRSNSNARTFLLIDRLTRAEVIKALRTGKMYAVKGSSALQFVLDRFVIRDSLSVNRGTIADEIIVNEKPVIEITGHFLNEGASEAEVALIRDGNVIKAFNVTSPFSIEYRDDDIVMNKKTHYRIEVRYGGDMLVTNPIFLTYEAA